MKDCKFCMNARYLVNAFGEESPCRACSEWPWIVEDQVKRNRRQRMAMAAAIDAIRNFGDQGKRKEAV